MAPEFAERQNVRFAGATFSTLAAPYPSAGLEENRFGSRLRRRSRASEKLAMSADYASVPTRCRHAGSSTSWKVKRARPHDREEWIRHHMGSCAQHFYGMLIRPTNPGSEPRMAPQISRSERQVGPVAEGAWRQPRYRMISSAPAWSVGRNVCSMPASSVLSAQKKVGIFRKYYLESCKREQRGQTEVG